MVILEIIYSMNVTFIRITVVIRDLSTRQGGVSLLDQNQQAREGRAGKSVNM